MSTKHQQVAGWLANGEHGVSSNTMAMYLAFDIIPKDNSHPHDPADFDRCLRLLAAAPVLRAELPRMERVSRVWRALVERWDELETLHLSEVGLGWTKARSAPKTYELMQQILYGAKHHENGDGV